MAVRLVVVSCQSGTEYEQITWVCGEPGGPVADYAARLSWSDTGPRE
jgi:hypothetical protein